MPKIDYEKFGIEEFDAAKFLKNEEMIDLFLAGSWEDSVEDNDPALFVRALETAARARGMARMAKRPSFEAGVKAMQEMGVRLVVGRPRRKKRAKAETVR